ncbi:hypothetical protein [uncultured Roseibium sp.]|uniref:hypothetical protein n=1 Tax=uncultured Roseibium sp. TaxID=1936171 RepID=UPI00321726CF
MFNLVKRYLDTTFGLEARFRTAFISGGILFAVEVFALLLSGYLEGTFYIEDGIGVFQTAIWIVVVGDWVLFLLLFKLTRELWSIPDAFPVIENEESEEYLENIKSDLLSRITLQGSSRNIIVILFLHPLLGSIFL